MGKTKIKRVFDACTYYIKKPLDSVAVFLHIPKNAGTTVNSILFSNYNYYRIYIPIVIGRNSVDGLPKTIHCEDQDIVTIRKTVTTIGNQLDCIGGHIPFGIHEYISKPCKYFTFLREPVDRSISQYNYAIMKNTLLARILERYDFDLSRVIEQKAAYQFMNDQTRMIIGSEKVDIGIDEFEQAKEVIKQHFVFVGTVGDFDKDILRLMKPLQWRHIPSQKENIGIYLEGKKSFDQNTIRLLKDANEYDIKLYEWVLNTSKNININ